MGAISCPVLVIFNSHRELLTFQRSFVQSFQMPFSGKQFKKAGASTPKITASSHFKNFQVKIIVPETNKV